MNILVTGGSGFLGKYVIRGLIQDSSIDKIYVVTRRPITFPMKKVVSLCLDLSKPIKNDAMDLRQIDKVIHLAGEYNFHGHYQQSYLGNVHATNNLVNWILDVNPKIQILYASTFAVLPQDANTDPSEKVLWRLPPRNNHYAFTKAIAENIIVNSGLSGVVFRLGILVGDSSDGLIDKINGPYYVMNLLDKLTNISVASKIPFLVIPGKKESYLPLVAVDDSARTFVKAAQMVFDRMEICGLYNPNSCTVAHLTETIFSKYLPDTKIFFTEKYPDYFLKKQEFVTKIPSEVFGYMSSSLQLTNANYQRIFAGDLPKKFAEFEGAFLRGFNNYHKGFVS